MIRAILLAAIALPLTACNGPGTEMSHGGRTAGENGCGGVTVTAGGGGAVGVMPQGAIGTVDVSPTGCKITITDWKYPPAAVAQATAATAAAVSSTK